MDPEFVNGADLRRASWVAVAPGPPWHRGRDMRYWRPGRPTSDEAERPDGKSALQFRGDTAVDRKPWMVLVCDLRGPVPRAWVAATERERPSVALCQSGFLPSQFPQKLVRGSPIPAPFPQNQGLRRGARDGLAPRSESDRPSPCPGWTWRSWRRIQDKRAKAAVEMKKRAGRARFISDILPEICLSWRWRR